MQQGRVQLDADWNEQADIEAHRHETAALDMVGQCGGARLTAGFALAASPAALPADQQAAAHANEPLKAGDLFISAGRYYVDGILCENERPVTLGQQPDAPSLELPASKGTYLFFLDVWQRDLTALDDPEILEVALGGPDTATRTKTIWQVRWVRVTDSNATCGSSISAFADETSPSTGLLTARAAPAPPVDNACMLEPGAGYRRLENQLYRVEIHDSGPLGTAPFKWSRDNGSVVSSWVSQSGNDLVVSSVGRDDVLGFAVGDYVELIDDRHELLRVPGTVVRVLGIAGRTLTIDPGTDVIDYDEFPL